MNYCAQIIRSLQIDRNLQLWSYTIEVIKCLRDRMELLIISLALRNWMQSKKIQRILSRIRSQMNLLNLFIKLRLLGRKVGVLFLEKLDKSFPQDSLGQKNLKCKRKLKKRRSKKVLMYLVHLKVHFPRLKTINCTI